MNSTLIIFLSFVVVYTIILWFILKSYMNSYYKLSCQNNKAMGTAIAELSDVCHHTIQDGGCPEKSIPQQNVNPIIPYINGNRNMFSLIRLCLFRMRMDDDLFGFEDISKKIEGYVNEFNNNQPLIDEWSKKLDEFIKENKENGGSVL